MVCKKKWRATLQAPKVADIEDVDDASRRSATSDSHAENRQIPHEGCVWLATALVVLLEILCAQRRIDRWMKFRRATEGTMWPGWTSCVPHQSSALPNSSGRSNDGSNQRPA